MWMQIEFVKTSFLIEYWHLIELDYFYIDCQWPWMHLILKKITEHITETKRRGKRHYFGYILTVSSVARSCQTLHDPMDCSTPGFPVHHQLSELAQNHVRVSDAVQTSHPLSSPSPPSLGLCQHQGLFQWCEESGGQSIGASALTSVLQINIQDWFPLGLIGLISLQSKGLSRVFFSTAVQKY